MTKQHDNYINYMHSMKEELVVLLENCLKDVPRSDQRLDKGCKQVLSSSISPNRQLLPRTLHAKNLESDTFMNSQNQIVPDPISSNEDCILCCDEIEPAAQTLNLTESLLLDLPIPNTINKDEVAKSSTIADSLLCWEKLAEPLVHEVKTPQTSGNSSVVDLDLTPPSSVASKSCLFEDTSCENSFVLDFDMLPDETAKVDVVKKVSADNCICNELYVEIACLEPTLRQLQVLHRRNEASGTATPNNSRKHSLRPKNSLKQFVPFMFEQAECMRERRKKRQSSNVFLSIPMLHNTDSVNIKRNTNDAKVEKSSCINGQFEKKQLKIAQKQLKKAVDIRQLKKQLKKADGIRQLKLALKEKQAFEKKQLKLALKQRKEALKYRNKFENALDSINMRICNQNSFWRMLPQ